MEIHRNINEIKCDCSRNSKCMIYCPCKEMNVLCREDICNCKKKCTNKKMPMSHIQEKDKLKEKDIQEKDNDKFKELLDYNVTLQDYNKSLQADAFKLAEQLHQAIESNLEAIKQKELLEKKLEQCNTQLKEAILEAIKRNELLEKEVEQCNAQLKEDISSKIEAIRKNEILEKEMEQYNVQLQESSEMQAKLCMISSAHEDENRSLKEKIQYLESRCVQGEEFKKKLLNEILDLKGNIRVFCRVRPLHLDSDDKETSISYSESVESFGRGIVLGDKEFLFDRVFDDKAGQLDVFKDVSELVQSVLDGSRVCILSYGQTGSGKTYTMIGSREQKGIIPRTLDMIFDSCQLLVSDGWKYSVKLSILEVYNEKIKDLLSPFGFSDMQSPGLKNLQIFHGADNGDALIKGLVVEEVFSAEQARSILDKASRNRSTARTKMNEQSSCSHFLCKLNIAGSKEGRKVDGILYLVDLAGSKRGDDRLLETKSINRSLASLADVINAIANGSDHVPYRNSVLTKLLEGCLGGDSKTLMLVNISPALASFQESLSSLNFASTVNATGIKHAHVARGDRSIKGKTRLPPKSPSKLPPKTPFKK